MSSHVTKFLLGIISRVDEKVPSRSQAIPIVRVGTGYSIQELTSLRNKLSSNFEQFDPRYAKVLGKPWKPDMKTKPDVIIKDLSKSVVLEVKASELQSTGMYPTGYTLRFPRVMRIRNDKPWNEAMNITDLNQMIADHGSH